MDGSNSNRLSSLREVLWEPELKCVPACGAWGAEQLWGALVHSDPFHSPGEYYWLLFIEYLLCARLCSKHPTCLNSLKSYIKPYKVGVPIFQMWKLRHGEIK